MEPVYQMVEGCWMQSDRLSHAQSKQWRGIGWSKNRKAKLNAYEPSQTTPNMGHRLYCPRHYPNGHWSGHLVWMAEVRLQPQPIICSANLPSNRTWLFQWLFCIYLNVCVDCYLSGQHCHGWGRRKMWSKVWNKNLRLQIDVHIRKTQNCLNVTYDVLKMI
jgi:hypothetical protein